MRLRTASFLALAAHLAGCASGSAPPPEDVALIETTFGDVEGETIPPYGGGDLSTATAEIVAVTLPVRLDIGEGIIDANRITVAIPPQTAAVEVQLRGENGETLASVRAEPSTQATGTRELEPITRETSVEAFLIAALSASSALDDRAPVATIRQWVTPQLADAIAHAAADRRDDEVERAALVRAMRGAIVVEQEVASETGLPLDARTLAQAEQAVARAYGRATYAADTPQEREQARVQLAADLVALRQEAGLDAAERLEVAHAAGFFERARTATTINATTALQAFVDATAKESLLREATFAAEALETLLLDAGVEESIVIDANALSSALHSAIAQAPDSTAMENAVVAFRTGLLAGDSSIFSRALGVTEPTQDAADAARQTARDERAVLQERLLAQTEELAALPSAPALTVAENVAQEYVAMRIRLTQNAVGLGVFGQRGVVGLGILLAAERFAMPVATVP